MIWPDWGVAPSTSTCSVVGSPSALAAEGTHATKSVAIHQLTTFTEPLPDFAKQDIRLVTYLETFEHKAGKQNTKYQRRTPRPVVMGVEPSGTV